MTDYADGGYMAFKQASQVLRQAILVEKEESLPQSCSGGGRVVVEVAPKTASEAFHHYYMVVYMDRLASELQHE